MKKQLLVTFACLFLFMAAHKSMSADLPGFEKDSILHLGPSTVRLVTITDELGTPNKHSLLCPNGERLNKFQIEFLDIYADEPEWKKVGDIITMGISSNLRKNHILSSHCVPESQKPFVYIFNIEVDEPHRHKGIGINALQTTLTKYEENRELSFFKLEVIDGNPHLEKIYKRLGFIKKKSPDDDIIPMHMYVKLL
jgi:hypothetical protein